MNRFPTVGNEAQTPPGFKAALDDVLFSQAASGTAALTSLSFFTTVAEDDQGNFDSPGRLSGGTVMKVTSIGVDVAAFATNGTTATTHAELNLFGLGLLELKVAGVKQFSRLAKFLPSGYHVSGISDIVRAAQASSLSTGGFRLPLAQPIFLGFKDQSFSVKIQWQTATWTPATSKYITVGLFGQRNRPFA